MKGSLSQCPKCKKWSLETIIYTNIDTPDYKYSRSFCLDKKCGYYILIGRNIEEYFISKKCQCGKGYIQSRLWKDIKNEN